MNNEKEIVLTSEMEEELSNGKGEDEKTLNAKEGN